MLVYREARRSAHTATLLEALRTALARPLHTQDSLVAALLRAGELECALADAESAAQAVAARIADLVAEPLLRTSQFDVRDARALIEALAAQSLPSVVTISPPEGFAYYALHPLAYASAVARLGRSEFWGVIGIRTIGSTLSAVSAAALRHTGAWAERITVRPHGHAFDRVTEFSTAQRSWIEGLGERARFLVVDEGPGLSGSSLLSVAEALERHGIAAERITLLSGHECRPARLCARDAAARWRRYRSVPAGHLTHAPADVGEDVGGGNWRERSYPTPELWRASWREVERARFLSRDGKRLFKFAGLGHYGAAVIERAQILARRGFAPPVHTAEHGFAAYEWVPGQPLCAASLDADILDRLAEYCAFRTTEFRGRDADRDGACARLGEMLHVNVRELLDIELPAELFVPPESLATVICDGRMQPHEWLRAADGKIVKTDGDTHGDDHFFPGPCDIAWDLAGAMVEWQMPPEAAASFLDRYERLSGDRVRARLPFYLASYAAFRAGYCQMAAQATSALDERPRLERDGERYAVVLKALIGNAVSAETGHAPSLRECCAVTPHGMAAE